MARSGQGLAGAGQRGLWQRPSCHEGPLPVGFQVPRIWTGRGLLSHKPWSDACRRERGATHTYASVTALSDPVGVLGVTMSALSTSAHPARPGQAIASHTDPAAGPCRQPAADADSALDQPHNWATCDVMVFLSHSANNPSAAVPHHVTAEAFELAPNLPWRQNR